MIGMQLWNEPAPTPVAPATVVADTDADIDAVLDENPDLYLWLASNDAYALALAYAMRALPILAVVLAALMPCAAMAISPPPAQPAATATPTNRKSVVQGTRGPER